jgi:hypothetical protein
MTRRPPLATRNYHRFRYINPDTASVAINCRVSGVRLETQYYSRLHH